ncbi:unnamed protein product [Polarella glacialis]|uniref:Uncharacterized protein n=1 Tax=Polarella glacialis TaxID=89957 RepID=A0A813GVR2_POLGL|nr:unnamed protein product [Polarella glacialis]
MVGSPEVSSNPVEAQRLHATGIGQFELPTASLQAVGSLHQIFQQVDIDAFFDLPHNAVLTVSSSASETHTFVVTHSQSTQSMRWLWACDSDTLDVFGKLINPEVQGHFLQAAGGPVEINAACYIIVKDGVTDKECVPHYDFYSPEIPRAAAFSLMTPMAAAHPQCVGGLEFWAWGEGADKAHKDSESAFRSDVRALSLAATPYHHGFATVVDGRLLHRTQPYSLTGNSDNNNNNNNSLAGKDQFASSDETCGTPAPTTTTTTTPTTTTATTATTTTTTTPTTPPPTPTTPTTPPTTTPPLTASIASGELRVLLCVNASRTTAESWPHLQRLLQRQVGLGFVQGNCSFSDADLDKAYLAPEPPKLRQKGGFLLSKLMR